MTRLHSDVKNLGIVRATPKPGSITELEQFALTMRPIHKIYAVTDVIAGVQIKDYSIMFDPEHTNYGKLYSWTGTIWSVFTPAQGTVGTNELIANCVTAAKIAGGAITGLILIGDVIETATSGARVQMSAANGFRLITAGGAYPFWLHPDGYVNLGTVVANPLLLESGNGTHDYMTLQPGNSEGTLESNSGLNLKCEVHDEIKLVVGSAGTIFEVNATSATLHQNMACDSGITIDGVDVSALGSDVSGHIGASTSVHGITGSVVGSNMTNTMGASGIIDAKTNSASVRTKLGPSFADAANPPTMSDGETLVCDCSGNSKTYCVHRAGSNYSYAEMYWNALPPALH